MPLKADAAAATAQREREAELQRALRSAQRQLDQAKVSRGDMVEAIYRAAHDAALARQAPAVPRPAKDGRRGTPETAVALLGDWQLGKRTPSYTTEKAVARIAEAGERLDHLTTIQRAARPIPNLHMRLLGDMVEGEDIFPGQAHVIDASLYRQLFTAADALRDYIRARLAVFERVHVTAIIGNHGRLGRKGSFNLESNADRMLYTIVRRELEAAGETRVTWTIPDGDGESSWYAIDRIGDVGAMVFHGYNLKGHAGFPWYGLGKKVGGWALGAIEDWVEQGVTEVDFGHWHQPSRTPINRVMAWCNGSTESHNTFAQEQLAASGRPSQGLRFVHPKLGTTSEHTLWLTS